MVLAKKIKVVIKVLHQKMVTERRRLSHKVWTTTGLHYLWISCWRSFIILTLWTANPAVVKSETPIAQNVDSADELVY